MSVLWAAWAAAGATLAFPIQHWVVRRLRADGGETGVRMALPRLAVATSGIAIATTGAAWFARASLFRREDLVFPVLMGLIPIGSAIVGLLRGGLAGRGRFLACGVALGAENLLRVGLALLAGALGWDANAFGWVLIAGFAIALAWPGALLFRREGAASAGEVQLAFLSNIAGGSLIAQLVLTGGPIAMALLDAPARAVTAMFAALAVFRAPYLVASGIGSRFTHLLTGFVVDRDDRRLRKALRVSVFGTLIAVGVGAGVAIVVGPQLVRALFGRGTEMPVSTLVVIAAGTGVALGTLAEGIVLISRGRAHLLLRSWGASLLIGVGWLILGHGSPADRVAWAFLASEASAFVIMLVFEARSLASPPASVDSEMLGDFAPGL
ncbi:MAG: hypothetical protein WD646_00740 [Actinomycetota bacterium]